MFRIAYDRRTNLLTIYVEGFWKAEDVPAFAAALDAKAREAKATRADFNVLVESLAFPVQVDDVADMMTQIMQAGIVMTSGRAAVVVGSLLNKMQAERTLAHPQLKVFRSVADAQAWLGQDVTGRLDQVSGR